MNAYIHRKTFTRMVGHSMLIHNGQKMKTTSNRKIYRLIWYVHAVEYYLAIKRNKLLIYIKAEINLKTSCWAKEARQKQIYTLWFHLYEIQSQAKPTCGDRNHIGGFMVRSGYWPVSWGEKSGVMETVYIFIWVFVHKHIHTQ